MDGNKIKEEVIDKEYTSNTSTISVAITNTDTNRRHKNINGGVKDVVSNAGSRVSDCDEQRTERSPTLIATNGNISPDHNNDSQSPPGTAGDGVFNHQRSNTGPLVKLRRFLSTLVQFANDLSPDVGERVRILIHNLVSGLLTIEEFQVNLQEITNYPLRSSVPGFLKALLPHAQRDIITMARQLKQTPLQYIRNHEFMILESSYSGEAGDIFISPPLAVPNSDPITSLKRRTDAMFDFSSTNGVNTVNNNDQYNDYQPSLSKRPLLMSHNHLLYPLYADASHYQNYQSHETQGSSFDRSSFTSGCMNNNNNNGTDDEWKNINTMLNCILSMVEKTKRALSILQHRGPPLESTETSDIKRVANEIMSNTVRQTEERVAEVRRRAEDAVNQVKRQALIDLQRAVTAAETKAAELISLERSKMERILADSRKHQNTSPNPVAPGRDSPSPGGSQNSCWNCGRKAQETCSGCNVARYCGSFCQHKDWEHHHQVCSSTRDQKPQSLTTNSPTNKQANTTNIQTDRQTNDTRAQTNIITITGAQNHIGGAVKK